VGTSTIEPQNPGLVLRAIGHRLHDAARGSRGNETDAGADERGTAGRGQHVTANVSAGAAQRQSDTELCVIGSELFREPVSIAQSKPSCWARRSLSFHCRKCSADRRYDRIDAIVNRSVQPAARSSLR
jgi:hypothetical protein